MKKQINYTERFLMWISEDEKAMLVELAAKYETTMAQFIRDYIKREYEMLKAAEYSKENQSEK